MNLRELASLLGLSATTVSRALNGYPEVSAETRARVAEAARRHGYAPNQVARRLATGRTQAIGHVIPLSSHQMINPLFAEFVAGAGEIYSAAGYDVLISMVPESGEEEAYRLLVSQRKVDGVIVHGPKFNDPRIGLLSELGLPFVVHGRDSSPEETYSWVDINNHGAVQRSTNFLLDLGHRRIAMLNGIETLNFAIRRRKGYEDALRKRGIEPNPKLIVGAEMTEPFGYEATREWLRHPNPPTAVVASSVMVALGVLRAIREFGFTAGQEFSIIAHDDDLSFLPNSGTVPLFTATRSPIRAAGRRCAELLVDVISDPAAGSRQELWEADLTLGRSTGPAPERPEP